MGLLKVQRLVLIGTLLGDGYIQPVGKRSARLRLEHASSQKEYIFWKWEIFKNYMQSKPKLIKRYNQRWKKWYSYYRCQSHSSPVFARYRRLFYEGGRKRIPGNIRTLLKNALTLAVWFMDDGYFYRRDKHIFLYLPKDYTFREIEMLKDALKENFGLEAKYKEKKEGSERYLWFDKLQSKKFIEIIKPHLLPIFKKRFL